jgi:hypothetical protein
MHMICSPPSYRIRRFSVWLIAFVWFLAITSGSLILLSRHYDAGSYGNPKYQIELKKTTSLKHLVVFLHPHCSCSVATIRNLGGILDQTSTTVVVEIFVYQPQNVDRRWSESELLESVKRIPNVRIRFDDGGTYAREYGVDTSGHVLLYSPLGQLLFSGGITDGRGKEGDSIGRGALLRILDGQDVKEYSRLPVFGCSLGK